MESHSHPLAVDESSHGDPGKKGLGTGPKAQGTIFHSADGEVQVQSKLKTRQDTVAEMERTVPALPLSLRTVLK